MLKSGVQCTSMARGWCVAQTKRGKKKRVGKKRDSGEKNVREVETS